MTIIISCLVGAFLLWLWWPAFVELDELGGKETDMLEIKARMGAVKKVGEDM